MHPILNAKVTSICLYYTTISTILNLKSTIHQPNKFAAIIRLVYSVAGMVDKHVLNSLNPHQSVHEIQILIFIII